MKLQPFNAARILLLLSISLVTDFTANAQDSPVIAHGAKLTLISNQFTFTEGPAADRVGNVFFTDQPNNRIWEYSVDGKLSLFMEGTGRSNGMFFDSNGNLITCADKHDQLWSIDPSTKKVTVLVNDFKGHRLNGPNDLWIDPKGGIYFTDPYYQRDYWKRTHPDINQMRVYYLTPDRKNVFIVVDDLVKPNGIIGTPDGKTLYIADIGDGKTYSYTIEDNAQLSHKTLFTNMGSDGMTLDKQGNVYLCGNGVTVFDSTGKQIEHILVPQKWTANVTFGGPNHQTLFMTASTAVYTLKMKVKGSK